VVGDSRTDTWYLGRFWDSLEGNAYQMAEVNGPRLEAILQVRPTYFLSFRLLSQSKVQRTAT